MAFSLPSETSVKHIKFLRGIFHSSNTQVLAVLVIIYLNFYLPGSLSRYRSHLLQWQPSLQQSIIDEKMILTNIQSCQTKEICSIINSSQHFSCWSASSFPKSRTRLVRLFESTNDVPSDSLKRNRSFMNSPLQSCNLWSLTICRVPALPLYLPAFATPHCGGIIWTGCFFYFNIIPTYIDSKNGTFDWTEYGVFMIHSQRDLPDVQIISCYISSAFFSIHKRFLLKSV